MKRVMIGSNVTIFWTFTRDNISDDVKISFLGRKNPMTLLRRLGGQTLIGNTDFKDRIEPLYDQSDEVGTARIGFRIKSVSRTDMGAYSIEIPALRIYNSLAWIVVDGKFRSVTLK